MPKISHKWASVRLINPDGATIDLVSCDTCGFHKMWVNVDPGSEIPREIPGAPDCGERVADQVMGS